MLSKLLYRGPALLDLRDHYAKLGRLDHEAPIVTSRETVIEAPVATVWRILADPAGWPAFDATVTDVRLDGPVEPDVEFHRRIGRAKVRAIFAVVEPSRELSWVGVSSGAKVVHRNLLSDAGSGRTRVVSEESMAGVLITLFYSRAKLDRALDGWLAALRSASEAAAHFPRS